jgi:hypothetical protein
MAKCLKIEFSHERPDHHPRSPHPQPQEDRPSPALQEDSPHIRELPTKIRRIRQRISSKHRRLRSRKKCKLQRSPRHESDHPLRIVRTAQTILVQKFLFPRHIQPIQTPTSRSCSVRVEESARLRLLKPAYSSDRKVQKIDGNLLVSKRHIPRDGLRGRARRTPISLILCRSRHAANQDQPHNRPYHRLSLHLASFHLLRMAFATSFDQPQPSISFRALKARPILA